MKNFMEKYHVSRETFERLKVCQKLLSEWQERFNLVGKNTLDDAWNRHFLDSAQLFKFIPENAETLYDLGSGAGFPGMVLAIMAAEKTPYLNISLIESTAKKTLYLNELKKQTAINVNIVNDRIENLPSVKVDVITSRALTALDNLLGYAHRFCKASTVCIFPKGRKYAEEIELARRRWKFDCRIEDSEQSAEGKILIITNLSKIKGEK